MILVREACCSFSVSWVFDVLWVDRQVFVGGGDGVCRSERMFRTSRDGDSRPLSPEPPAQLLALRCSFFGMFYLLCLACYSSYLRPGSTSSAKPHPCFCSAAAAAAGATSLSGDPFTVMNAYDEWIRVKAARQESSRRWCKRHGLQEQRLYEITKLRRQFDDLLGNAGLLWLGAAAQRARAARAARGGGGSKTGGGAGASKDKLRELKMRREGRKRKVLQVDHGQAGDGKTGLAGGGGGSGGESGGEDDAEEAQRDLRGEVGEGEVDGEAGLDLSSLEFYAAQDVGECFGAGS